MRQFVITPTVGSALTLGPTLVGATNGRYMIETLDGMGPPGTDIQTQKSPYQDGDTYIDAILQPRDIVIGGSIYSRVLATIQTYRLALIDALNPKLGPAGIVFTNDNASYSFNAIAKGSPLFKNKLATEPWQKFQITLHANDPYFYAGSNTTVSPAVNSNAAFANGGDSLTPVTITLTGPLTAFSVYTYDALSNKIELTMTSLSLADSATLIITTGFGAKSCLMGATNMIGYLTTGSTFWQLPLGTGTIYFTGSGSGAHTACSVVYKNRWVGL